MLARQTLIVLVALTLAATACASDSGGAKTASGAATTLPTSTTAQLGLVGTPTGRLLLESLYQLVVVDGACGTPSLPRDDTHDPAVGEAVERVLAAIEAVDEACDDPAEWSSRMRAVVDAIDQLDQVALLGVPGRTHQYEELPTTDDPMELGPYVVRSLERLHHTLRAARAIDASNLWFSSQQLGLTASLRELAETDASPRTVIIGSSIGYRGIDAEVVGEALGQPVMNASMLSGGLSVMAAWRRELQVLGAGTEHLVWAINTHELFNCTFPAAITNPATVRRTAFGPWLGPDDTDRLDWILGPVGAPVSPSSPIGNDWLEHYADADPSLDDTEPERLAKQRDNLDSYDEPELCQAELESAQTGLSEALGTGATATLVVMPIADELTNAHPEGAAGHRSALAELTEAIDPRVEILDYSDSMGDEFLADLVHLNGEGRTQFSAILAADLTP